MNLSWGVHLWDCLDIIVDHSNDSSNLIDKSSKCFTDCRNVWTKAAQKQKRLLDKLQAEVNDSEFGDGTLQASLLGIINNLTSICNIESTFQESLAKVSDDTLKKTHSQIKRQSNAWSNDKEIMEENLLKGRRKYEAAVKRYREKYQAMILADESLKKSSDNRGLSRSQVDIYQTSYCTKRDEYDESKREYVSEFSTFNALQQAHFKSTVVDWATQGEKLHNEKILLLKNISNDLAKFTKEMIKNLGYSLTRFTDISEALSFEKDLELLIQKYKTGDVPPGELQFANLDNGECLSKSSQSIYECTDNVEKLRGSSVSMSNCESNVGLQNESIFSVNYSSLQPFATPGSGRSRVNNVKNKESARGLISDGRFSLRKSKNIFRSSVPWKASESTDKPVIGDQRPHYKRNSRCTVKQSGGKEQRSHSVTDVLSNVFGASFHQKYSGQSDVNVNVKKQSLSPAAVTKETIRIDDSDFDTDSSYENNNRDTCDVAAGIKVNYVVAQESMKERSVHSDYLGSCVSYHDFDSNDPSNEYLSFKAGDQFGIIKMDRGSGWMFVETSDGTMRGFVPTSYMDL